jgi:hypothetical protein
MNDTKRECLQCGRVGEWKGKLCHACYQRNYRKRQNIRLSLLTNTVSQSLTEDLSHEDSRLVFALLNTVSTRKQVKAIDEAMRIVINSYRAEIRKAKRIGRNKQNAIISE